MSKRSSLTRVLILLLGQVVFNNLAVTQASNTRHAEASNLRVLGQTPINNVLLEKYLESHPNRELVNTVVSGFRSGFSLHYKGPRGHMSCKNLKSVFGNEEAALQKIRKEISAGRVAGPFDYLPLPSLRVSPIGLVPKKDGTWRLIHHLSYPLGKGINFFIDESLCTVHYTSFDNIIDIVNKLGPKTLMGKMDIKSAFRLLPIDPLDFELLGFKLGEQYFVDKCLPMGCAISCSLFEKFSSIIEWLVRDRTQGVHEAGLDHYLDDFFFAGRENTSVCANLMYNFEQLCKELGVPIAEDKTVLPTPVLVFLGLEIDSILMQIRIPQEKLSSLRELLLEVYSKSKVTLRKLQSLTGVLNFCVRAIPSARAFIRRFYDAMSGIRKCHHFVRVSSGMKQDIQMWLHFLDQFNGYCSFPERFWINNCELQLFTDSAGGDCSKGGGAFFQGMWAFFSWPSEWANCEVIRDITFLELIPIVMALFIWGSDLRNKKNFAAYR